ncbi:hypothetical protein EAI_00477, partial [Harpegnathos saltator]
LIQRIVKYPIKVHAWRCFSKPGFGTLHFFTDNLYYSKVIKIYEKAFVSFAQK